MTVNSYVTNLANSAILRDAEKRSIQRSISTIQSRLNSYFGGEVAQHFLFGSYTRGTILPRSMDQRSDIDYMVVFNDSNFQPQTYLNKLNRFVNTYYSSSEISQSNPTIVLSLNHIKFELVPAISTWLSGLKIPAKASAFDGWIETDPNDFNQTLVNANQANGNMIKPMVRLVKYWNAKNNYIFESYELEKILTEKSYWHVGGMFSNGQLKDYFLEAMESLELNWSSAQYKKDALNRAHQLVREVKYYQQRNMESEAEKKIRKLIPSTISSLSLLGSY